MILPNESAIREGLSHVPYSASVLTTEHYAPHLSHRPWIQIIPIPPVSTLGPEAEAIFLNLRDFRFFAFRRCEDYFETLKAAARQISELSSTATASCSFKSKMATQTSWFFLNNWSDCR